MEQKAKGGRVGPFLPAHLSWDMGLLLPLDWDFHHQLRWVSGLQTRTGATADRGAAQPPQSCEPTPNNQKRASSPFRFPGKSWLTQHRTRTRERNSGLG